MSRQRLSIALIALAVLLPVVGANGRPTTYRLDVTMRRTDNTLAVVGAVTPNGFETRRVDVVIKTGKHKFRWMKTTLGNSGRFNLRLTPPGSGPVAVSVKIGALRVIRRVG